VRFILASASPARLETLQRAGVRPDVVVSGVDESTLEAGSPKQLAQVLAEAKLRAVRARVQGEALILGCDSLLEFDGAAYGKPGRPRVAAERWRAMRGKSGILHTGHALMGPKQVTLLTVSTTVHFADVTDDEIDCYCATGEPAAVAGGFTIDGLGGWFIEAVEGDPHNVVGVSLPILRRMLREQGFELSDVGYPAPR
jgi:septum formation protein